MKHVDWRSFKSVHINVAFVQGLLSALLVLLLETTSAVLAFASANVHGDVVTHSVCFAWRQVLMDKKSKNFASRVLDN